MLALLRPLVFDNGWGVRLVGFMRDVGRNFGTVLFPGIPGHGKGCSGGFCRGA